MNAENFRAYCLGKKAATEGSPFGPDNIVFKVKARCSRSSRLMKFRRE